jgi:hypothetical protein
MLVGSFSSWVRIHQNVHKMYCSTEWWSCLGVHSQWRGLRICVNCMQSYIGPNTSAIFCVQETRFKNPDFHVWFVDSPKWGTCFIIEFLKGQGTTLGSKRAQGRPLVAEGHGALLKMPSRSTTVSFFLCWRSTAEKIVYIFLHDLSKTQSIPASCRSLLRKTDGDIENFAFDAWWYKFW